MDRPDEPRTHDIYEQLPAYPLPPVIPLPDLRQMNLWGRIGLRNNPLSRAIVQAGVSASGLRRWAATLPPESLADLLRRYNLRLPGLYAPTLSATGALADDPRPLTPAQRAASLVFGAYNLRQALYSGELEPDRLRGEALEMGQYPNLFSTSLLVEGRMPRLFKSVFEPQITVLLGGRFYTLHLGDPPGESWVEELAAALERLAQANLPLSPEARALGTLTAAAHPTQLRAFNLLAANPRNAANLRRMRRSFMTLCLDLQADPASPAEAARLAHSANFAEAARLAHSANFANRWFHSSLQLVVFGNAAAAAILSFTAYLDGNTMMRGMAEIQQRAAAYPFQNEYQPSGQDFQVAALEWELDERALPARLYQRAQQESQACLDSQPCTFELEGYGREFFERLKLNPVPAFVTALQSALNQLTGRRLAIHQFASLSRYRCMDVTPVKISTPALQELAQVLNGSQPGRASELIGPAIESQLSELHNARQSLPLEMLLALFARSRQGAARLRARLSLIVCGLLLLLLGQLRLDQRREALISHPEIYPQVPVIGRPGVRLPYLKAFGLHYQIWPERSVLTFMPGLRWPQSNQAVVAALKQALDKLPASGK